MSQPVSKQEMRVPRENPFVTTILMCPSCGQFVLPTVARMSNGSISNVSFYHVNEAVGCAWKVREGVDRARGECTGLVQSVREGVDNKGQPKYVDEHDKAKGKSFDPETLTTIMPQTAKNAAANLLADVKASAGQRKPHPATVQAPKTATESETV